jgi:hypothetical protein
MQEAVTVVPQNLPITRPDGSVVEVPNVTLAAWKAALRMEVVGLKGRGRAASAIVKETLGLPKRLSKQQTLDVVIDLLEQYHKGGA